MLAFTSVLPAMAETSGYYLVVDDYISGAKHDAISAYILSVPNNEDIKLKTDIPDVTKEIVDGDNKNSTTTEIGTEVTHR